MNCREFRELLDEEGNVTDPAAEEHLEECEACRELVAAEGRLVRALETIDSDGHDETPALEFDRLEEDLHRDAGFLGRLRESSTRLRSALVAVAALAVAAVVFSTMPRPDVSHYPPLRLWGLAVGFFGVAVASSRLALRPIYRPELSGRTNWAVLTLVLLYGAGIGALPPAHGVEPYLNSGIGPELVPAAVGCFVAGSIFALPVAVVGWLALRSTRPLLYRGILLAAASGTVGHLGLHLHCPLVRPRHLLLGHATVAVAYAALAGLLVYALDRS